MPACSRAGGRHRRQVFPPWPA